jgi:hypothetical protein
MAHSQPWMGDQRWSSTRMGFGEISLWQAHGPRGPCTPWSAWPLGQSHNASVQTISSVCDLTDRDGHFHTGGYYEHQNQTDHAAIDEVPQDHSQNTYGDSVLWPVLWSAVSAHAGLNPNGLNPNGLSPNGLTMNGLTNNGWANGLALQPTRDDQEPSRVVPNDRLPFNGLSQQGIGKRQP